MSKFLTSIQHPQHAAREGRGHDVTACLIMPGPKERFKTREEKKNQRAPTITTPGCSLLCCVRGGKQTEHWFPQARWLLLCRLLLALDDERDAS